MEPTGIVPLSQAKQVALNSQKRSQRLVNERYFRKHPELRTMTKAFLASMLEKRPDDVGEFATNFFGQSDRTPAPSAAAPRASPPPAFCRCSTAPAADRLARAPASQLPGNSATRAGRDLRVRTTTGVWRGWSRTRSTTWGAARSRG